jgi:hypothetical protein
MTQWFHVYEMDDDIVNLVLRTFGSVFPHVEIWDLGGGDIALLGSMQPWSGSPDVFRQGFGLAGVKADLASIGIQSPEALLARQLASQRTAFAIAGEGPVQSDFFPMLEYAAPRAFYVGAKAGLFEQFDERTRQQSLAPPAKLAALHALSRQDVLRVFIPFATMNGELLYSLLEREAALNVPCVFRTNPQPARFNNWDESTTTLNRAVEALNAGDCRQARQLAALALRQNPTNTFAAYVTRVIVREAAMASNQRGNPPP